MLSNQKIDNCLFCQIMGKNRVIAEYGSVFAILDKYPVTPGHHLVITKRHISDYFGMSSSEKRDAVALLSLLRNKIIKDDPTVQGFNVGMNCGETAGQTVMHAHIHLIPRRSGDIDNPRGGVRGCVPGKMQYNLV